MGLLLRGEYCRLLDSTFLLFAGRSPDIETSLEVSSSLVSGGASPLAVTIEYCGRLEVAFCTLEVCEPSDDVLTEDGTITLMATR